MSRIILASKSPRRRELLRLLGFTDFIILPAEGEEAASGAPGDAVRRIALSKARESLGRFRSEGGDDSALVLAADTLVYLDGAPLGKPADEADAVSMLRRLSGKKHFVYTGVALLCRGTERTFFEETAVYFRDMREEEIIGYVKSGEPMDKAGAYGAQGLGAAFIERIEGDFFNVVGLPVCRLSQELKELGILPPALSKGVSGRP
ncbi:MAG: septum formation protein Maf [Clostridiales bacterium]|nr:septum formation protein Maf [Clostridiales bacterium]